METPWTAKYPTGIPSEINPDLYPSLIALFEEAISKYGDLVAFENMDKTMSFNELDQHSRAFGDYLQNSLGLQKGDRVAIQMPNLLQYPVAMLGVLRAGCVVVNTNPLYTAREMEHQFNDSGAKAVVILANFAFNLEKILANTSIKHVVVTEIGDMLSGIKRPLVNFVVKRVRKMVPAYSLPTAVPFRKALAAGKADNLKVPEFSNEDVAFLQYTGGTTGVSKGATLTHRNLVANLEQNYAWMGTELNERKETVITALPLYHIFALTVNCLLMLKIGARNILVTNPRDMKGFIKTLSKQPFSVITGVNTLFNGLLNQPNIGDVNFGDLKVAVGGGMAVQKAVAEKWKATTGCTLVEGYGLSETAPVLSCNPLDGSERIGTIGLPVPSTLISLRGDDGQPVGVGEVGEICAKGPQVMKGYWNRPDETDKVFHDGWFTTGDMGVMDEDGFFRIVDRKKEMINVSGFNVYPNEVENVVASHEKVLEVGAIGIPDSKSTEVVKIYVVKKDESLTAEELKAYCRDNLTAYKCPREIEFKDELPKSNVGKILRRILKEEALKKMEEAGSLPA